MTANSMTGFGEARIERDGISLRVEVKSVNHRFLDVSCKLPTLYSSFENELQLVAREGLKRGRLEVGVHRLVLGESTYEIVFQEGFFKTYVDSMKQAMKVAGVKDKQAFTLALSQLLLRRDVLEVMPAEVDLPKEKDLLLQAFREALGKLQAMRLREGGVLQREVLGQLGRLEEVREALEKAASQLPELSKQRLQARLDKLLGDKELVDPQRLSQEVAILADRSDVSEELLRLKSHCEQFRSTIAAEEAAGRKLEFILQEMGREINTTGSKAQSTEIVNLVIEGKALVEKMREQVLNIE